MFMDVYTDTLAAAVQAGFLLKRICGVVGRHVLKSNQTVTLILKFY